MQLVRRNNVVPVCCLAGIGPESSSPFMLTLHMSRMGKVPLSFSTSADSKDNRVPGISGQGKMRFSVL